MRQEPVDPAIKAAIENAIKTDMAGFGYRSVDVAPGVDHDGDPVIFVDVHYEDSNEPVDPKAMAKLALEISRLSRTLGEDRFPHVRHDFREDRAVLGYP